MNRCDSYLENLSAYLDGELSTDEKKTLEEHLEQCDACVKELQTQKAMITVCGELAEELPYRFETSLHRRLEQAKAKTAGKSETIRKIKRVVPIAAGLILVLCLGLMIRAGLFDVKAGKAESAAPMMIMQDIAPEEPASGEAAGLAIRSIAPEVAVKPEEDTTVSRGSNKVDYGLGGGSPDEDAFEGEIKSDEDQSMAMIDNEDVRITFNEETSYAVSKAERQDTIIKISTEDTTDTLNLILKMNTGMGESRNENRENLNAALEDVSTGSTGQIEVELIYPEDSARQDFINEMQSTFPNMQVQVVPAKDDRESVRILIQK